MSLKEQLAEYRADWFKRVPAERQAVIERHVNELRNGLAKTALKTGDHAPAIVLTNAKGETVDVGMLLKRGPVIVTFYRGGCTAIIWVKCFRESGRCMPKPRGGSISPLEMEKIAAATSLCRRRS